MNVHVTRFTGSASESFFRFSPETLEVPRFLNGDGGKPTWWETWIFFHRLFSGGKCYIAKQLMVSFGIYNKYTVVQRSMLYHFDESGPVIQWDCHVGQVPPRSEKNDGAYIQVGLDASVVLGMHHDASSWNHKLHFLCFGGEDRRYPWLNITRKLTQTSSWMQDVVPDKLTWKTNKNKLLALGNHRQWHCRHCRQGMLGSLRLGCINCCTHWRPLEEGDGDAEVWKNRSIMEPEAPTPNRCHS